MPYFIPPQYSHGVPNPVAPAMTSGGAPPSSSMTKEELQSYIKKVVSESIVDPKAQSITDYCKLPPVYFPPSFKAPKYQKYDGMVDPHHDVSGFIMDSHQFLHDKALLVHLFQKSLEGEALMWFSSLSVLELTSFDIMTERFISHFSHLTHQTPTLFDLVMEKMKPDEDFLHFANRSRTMVSRSEVIIPKAQAVAMIVNNTTSQLRAILMLSELHTFSQLYNRAKIVQAQIRESVLHVFFKQRPRGRKPVPVPTTEGVTAFQNPPI